MSYVYSIKNGSLFLELQKIANTNISGNGPDKLSSSPGPTC